MSRLGGDISLRESAKGGDVSEHVRIDPSHWMEHYTRIVILVHGYNNNFCAGCRSYADFLKRVPERFPKVGRLFWPGDITPAIISGASYSWQIETAKECGRKLATFLAQLASRRSVPIEVSFVGHSLGCRVVLETLKAAEGMPVWPEVRAICLMAAAVPVGLVEPDAELEEASQWVDHRLVLFSPSDRILRLAFPLGQTLAYFIGKEDRIYLSAVGLKGMPESYRTTPGHMEGNGHSDYWSDRRIFRYIAPVMGIAVEHTVEPRWLPGHDAPAPVEPLIRRTPERRIAPAWRSDCESC
jgi:pimeloyl-ACP methyl ester carboxylesterase